MSLQKFPEILRLLRMTLPGLEKLTRENPNLFANQNAPTKVLPFHGILCVYHVDL
jgi:hypothetical protein